MKLKKNMFKLSEHLIESLYETYKRIEHNNFLIKIFKNDSYQNIVRVDLTDQITNIKPYNLKIIYGSEDNMVNPFKVIETVPDEYKKRIFMITGGNHDIANTHFKEILDIIRK